MDDESRLDKTTILSIATLLGLVVIFGGASIMANNMDEQNASPWRGLVAPPDKAAQIVYAEPFTVWIKTADKQIYQLIIDRKCVRTKDCSSEGWVSVKIAPTYPSNPRAFKFDTNCSTISEENIPPLPSGPIMECVRAEANPEVVYISYFILQADGTLQYWFKENWIGNSAGNYVISAILLTLIVIISLFTINLFLPAANKSNTHV